MNEVTREQLAMADIQLFLEIYDIKNEQGNKLDFHDHPYLWDIFNDLAPHQAVRKAAQIGFSTTAIIKSLWLAKAQKMDLIYCVDTETECLSKRGFLKYNELTLNDEILTLSLEGRSTWERVEEVFSNTVNTTMYEYNTRNFSALATENHRWIVHNQYKKYEILTSKDLQKQLKYIPKTVESYKSPEKTYSNEYVELLSWVFSEGYYCKQPVKKDYSIILTQSPSHNPVYCEDIRDCLRRNNSKWIETYSKFNGCINFRFAFDLGKKIKNDFPLKVPTAEFASKLTREQAQLFIETFVKADGWIDKLGTKAITQKSKECVDILNMIAVIGGYAPSLVKPSVNGCYTLRLTQFPVIYAGELKPVIKKMDVTFWCPSTKIGTFYARRKGRCYWTGNTLPTYSDVHDFVSSKVNRIIDINPIFKKWCADKDTIEQKRVGDSVIYYRGTFSERAALMVSSDLNVHDEVDRSNLKVVDQYYSRLQHSKYGWQWLFSNPSVPDVGVDKLWNRSDQKHWFVPCPKCNHQQYLTMRNIIDRDETKKEDKDYYFGCVKCGAELNRRKGKWVKRWPQIKDISGYWISLLMCPWVTANNIKLLERTKSAEFFDNFVLGVPHVGSGNSVTKDVIFRNLTDEINEQDGRIVIGVDPGIDIRYVVGNKKGLFYYGSCKDYTELDNLMKRWDKAIMVMDQGGDIIGSRQLRDKYRHRVFLASYRTDRKDDELFKWNDEGGTVQIDRNNTIQLLIDELKDKRLPLYGTEADWYDYWVHWSHIYRTVEEDSFGRPRYKWQRSDRDDFVHATVYFRCGIDRFMETEGAIIEINQSFGTTGLTIDASGKHYIRPKQQY